MSSPDALPPPPPLHRLAGDAPLTLFLDFDGTLVELAETPDGIEVPPTMCERLKALAERLDGRLAVVTGRALEDIEDHLPDIAVARAGSHGAARKYPDGRWLGEEPKGLPDAVVARMRDFAENEGLLYETKSHGGALHYRAVPECGPKVLSFVEDIAADNDLVIKTGRSVVELVRPGAAKGGAVRAFLETPVFAGAQPWFLGDDVTDDDGFSACSELGGGGVLVGNREGSTAHFALANVARTIEWLGL
ncbi:MAG: trehalose-phosphatase [Erythrobacter sp.]|nr:trehalose-phosphatase [Erythrobacter sp.]